MFEQAVLSDLPSSGRYWAVMMGLTGELVLVGCVLTLPLLWPQLLPQAAFFTSLILPPQVPQVVKAMPLVHMRPTRPYQMIGDKLLQPAAIPGKVGIIDDAPSGVSAGPVAVEIGSDIAGLAASLRLAIPDAPPVRAVAPSVTAASKPTTTEPRRVPVGTGVRMARLIHRVEPVYPMIARQARISGTVELTGVIGVDGRIRELEVLRGHPLLSKSALEVVRQWVYEPTLLNGEPVEVIAPITVNFRLN